MAHRFIPILLVAILATVGVAGCLDAPSPVYVPTGLVPEGWTQQADNKTESAAGGNVEVVMNHYAFNDQLVAELFLVGVTDVPFVDEVDQLEKQIDDQVQTASVQMTRTGATTMTLDNGQKVDLIEYDVRKATATGEAHGKAWRMNWDDGDFIGGGFGYATTEYRGLIGSAEDDTQWLNVQAMMRASTW